jgi:hypothetical protein
MAPSAPKFVEPPRAQAPSSPQIAERAAQPSPPARTAAAGPPPLPPPNDDEATVVARPPMMPVGPAPAPLAEPSEEVEARIRSAVEAAVRPLQQSMLDMQRQLEEAQRIVRDRERAMALAASAAPAHAPPPLPAQPQSTSVAHAVAVPAAIALATRAAPAVDLAAIARDRSIEIDSAFDGSKRKRRAVILFALVILAIFGSLFGALAASYAHH